MVDKLAGTVKTAFEVNLDTVSYTHLDVYKRQMQETFKGI